MRCLWGQQMEADFDVGNLSFAGLLTRETGMARRVHIIESEL